MFDEFRRIALFTSGVAELSRNRAEQLVRGLVKSGEVRREQTSTWVKNLMDASRQNRKELIGFVRSEIRSQVESLGLATKRDLERLDRRVARLEAAKKKSTQKKTTQAKTTTRKPRSTGTTQS
jgi:polyhydroxyalkanoate synthesis regulator phasin